MVCIVGSHTCTAGCASTVALVWFMFQIPVTIPVTVPVTALVTVMFLKEWVVLGFPSSVLLRTGCSSFIRHAHRSSQNTRTFAVAMTPNTTFPDNRPGTYRAVWG